MAEQLSPSQAARELGMSRETVKNWLDQGKLAGVRTPIGRLVDADSVRALAAERTAIFSRRSDGDPREP